MLLKLPNLQLLTEAVVVGAPGGGDAAVPVLARGALVDSRAVGAVWRARCNEHEADSPGHSAGEGSRSTVWPKRPRLKGRESTRLHKLKTNGPMGNQ